MTEDTQKKLLELGLHRGGFFSANNWFYKNHFESFIFSFDDFYCCIYDFTIKKNNLGQLEIFHKSNISVNDENKLIPLMNDVIKRYKEAIVELKKRELENDF